jgi:hypothetical protein
MALATDIAISPFESAFPWTSRTTAGMGLRHSEEQEHAG